MINQNTIRSTLPNPTLEPELYRKVNNLQIHTCNSKCGGPAPTNSRLQFLMTDPPNIRTKAILPLYMIDSLDDNPYWSDKIEQYFAHPNNPEFDTITYKTYYETYEIKSSRPNSSRRTIYQDNLGNFVIK
ncbi:23821_t:CDS:2, partial [Gigaspora rosea]